MTKNAAIARAVAKAAQALGGEDKLAERLHMPLAQLRAWCAGESTPPPNALIRISQAVQHEALKTYDSKRSGPVLFRK